MKKKLLICGATGFIGRNLVDYFFREGEYELYASYHHTAPPSELTRVPALRFIQADLTNKHDVERVVKGMNVVIQAAATTSGAKEIVSKPYYHVTDNAVMNSLLFRACFEHDIERVVFFSCTVLYREKPEPVRESDFDYDVMDKYFGAGWTKIYIEKLCEFYSRISPTKYTAIRHSNIYGPYAKYDLDKSHVVGATIAKVMASEDGRIVVWGDGAEARDFLYVDDLVHLVSLVLEKQTVPFELINAGCGEAVSVRELVARIVKHSNRDLKIEYDPTKPTIPYKLSVNIDRVIQNYGWRPQVSLDEGIKRTLQWYQCHHLSDPFLA